MLSNHVTVRRAGAQIGAFIENVDLSRPLADEDFATIRQALTDHCVIFFRDQELSEEQHIAVAHRFGRININRFFTPVPGHPQIAEVRKEPHQKSNIGSIWHTDHSYDVSPALGSILYARIVPEIGGDTIFANMGAVFDSLSPGLQQTLQGLRALHSTRHVFGKDRPKKPGEDREGRIGNAELAIQDTIHPVVIRHPDSGRKILFVNPEFTVGIEGWLPGESKALLDYLYAQAQRPDFQYRFQWKKGSLAFWDNRASWHYALNDYHGHRRLMHRITIEGVPLAAA
ncbi:MAG: TauD/TfdA family dioxygenase [Alphaproteobacteria bacterium]|nr:TauD/TfdA family dioxygenase [Alphaproteobacteria bacterium]